MAEPTIFRITTRSGNYYAVGQQPMGTNQIVASITHGAGDPVLLEPPCYIVHLENGETIEVYDYAEVWYR